MNLKQKYWRSKNIFVTRSSKIYIVVGDIILGAYGFNKKIEYDVNLLAKEQEYDIIAIYRTTRFGRGFDIINNLRENELLWRREEKK